MQRTVHTTSRVIRYPRRDFCIAFILTLGFLASPVLSSDPADLARRVAEREAAAEAERANYMYTQSVQMQEIPERRGRPGGEYREVREVIFSPKGERIEQAVGKPTNTLQRLRMTEEDFRDIREIQPLLLTPDLLFMYEIQIKGEETIDGIDSWVLQIRPRQILHGIRYFDGLFWVDKRDYSILRSEGRAVPQIYSTKVGKENLFPAFITIRAKHGDYWFPIHTYANDTLPFSSGPVRIRLNIRYRDYKRFGAESNIIVQPE